MVLPRREPSSAWIPAHPREVGGVRKLTESVLSGWRIPESVVYVAQVLVSEVFTNAVRHGDGEDISVAFSYAEDEVRIEVGDGSPGVPKLMEPDLDSEHGRGMDIVSKLAKEWGVSSGGMTTWFTIPAAEVIAWDVA
ncbi:ATP-binding protein [Streptomyces sp. 110]|uniref:ATP-binding protein n=1 Tax=Streptomyces endocoffeicus TaxID=2898945 RepID=A0ABS1PTQ9_9ACTN|nr:ATP-binding protein [Streptomyces endocoffeicus]MBL1115297.1 ATP-binding protein [Streptomyces endocoffeicus]